MTSESEAVHKALNALRELGLDYMIVGSHAASVHGFTRATHDLDIVVSLHSEDIGKLAEALGEEFFLDVESARDALRRGDMFNAIHVDSGIKMDFWILAADDFSRAQFSRRRRADVEGTPAWVASAEDTVLSKLLWYRVAPSDRQLADARGIIEIGRGRLDCEYLSTWAERLGIEDLLAQAQGE